MQKALPLISVSTHAFTLLNVWFHPIIKLSSSAPQYKPLTYINLKMFIIFRIYQNKINQG